MIVQFEDQEYTLDIDGMDLPDARYIKRKTGMGLMDLHRSLLELEPEALAALYWLMMKQTNGKVMDIERLNFKPVLFGEAVIKALSAEVGEGEEDEADGPKDPKS